jgi:hypothetical protein
MSGVKIDSVEFVIARPARTTGRGSACWWSGGFGRRLRSPPGALAGSSALRVPRGMRGRAECRWRLPSWRPASCQPRSRRRRGEWRWRATRQVQLNRVESPAVWIHPRRALGEWVIVDLRVRPPKPRSPLPILLRPIDPDYRVPVAGLVSLQLVPARLANQGLSSHAGGPSGRSGRFSNCPLHAGSNPGAASKLSDLAARVDGSVKPITALSPSSAIRHVSPHEAEPD